MVTSNTDLTQFAVRLGWTLIHSLWQGAVVAMMLGIALALLRRRSAQSRYVASLAASATILAAAGVTFRLTAPAVETRLPSDTVSIAVAAPVTSHAHLARPLTPETVTEVGRDPIPASSPRPLIDRARGRLEPILPWLTIAWAAGVLMLGLWHGGGWVAAQRLRVVGVSPPGDELLRIVHRLTVRLGLRRPVSVALSALAQTPMAIGWLRPMVLLPAAILTGLTPAQLEGILAHELAHICRHDYLVNLLQVLAETLLFYHPAVWWISRRVRLEREQCCDDIAVRACGDRWLYAESLAAVEELRFSMTRAFAFSAAGAGRGQMLARVRHILGIDASPARPATAGALAGGTLVLLLTTVLTVGLLRAQSELDAATGRPIARESAARPAAPNDEAPQRPAASVAPAIAPSKTTPQLQFLVEARPDESGDTVELKDHAGQSYRFQKAIVLSESDVKGAHEERGQNGKLAVDLEFTEAGAAKLLAVTSANLNRRLAIVFDGRVLSMPVIRSAISHSAMIDGGPDGMTPEQGKAICDAVESDRPSDAGSPATLPSTAPTTQHANSFTADCVLSGLVDGKRKVLASPSFDFEPGATIWFAYTGKPPVITGRPAGKDGSGVEVRAEAQPDGRVRIFCRLRPNGAAGEANGDPENEALRNALSLQLLDLKRRLNNAKELLADAQRHYTLEEICRVDPALLAKVNARNEQQTTYDYLVTKYGTNYPQSKEALQLLQIRQRDVEESVKRFNDEFFIEPRSDGGPGRAISKDLSKLRAIVENYQKQLDAETAILNKLSHATGGSETDQIVRLGEPVAVELADGTRLEVSVSWQKP